ncbi:MAG: hypothetical protein D4R74_08980 [Betaproteobacteria bacterium]|nr:MAG: hypothetical protein D4R74_08980 [Betaproteobacteria bacterium]
MVVVVDAVVVVVVGVNVVVVVGAFVVVVVDAVVVVVVAVDVVVVDVDVVDVVVVLQPSMKDFTLLLYSKLHDPTEICWDDKPPSNLQSKVPVMFPDAPFVCQ